MKQKQFDNTIHVTGLNQVLDELDDVAVCILDDSYKIHFSNTCFHKYTHHSETDLIGKSYIDFIKSKSIQLHVLNLLEEVKNQSKIGKSNMVRVNFKDKPDDWFETNWILLEYDKSKYFLGLHTKLLQKEQKWNNKPIESFHKEGNSLIGSWNLDLISNKLKWTDPLFKIFDIEPKSFKKTRKCHLNLVISDDHSIVNEAYDRCITSGSPFHIQYRILDKENHIQVIEEFGFAARDQKKKIVRIYGTTQNITERIHTQKRLMDLNERYEMATQATNEAIWDWDIENERVSWGENFEKLFGYKRRVFTNSQKAAAELLHPEERDGLLEKSFKLLSSQENFWEDEHRFKRIDGSFAFVHNRAIILRSAEGKAIKAVGAMRDITISKIEQERLRLMESVITNTNDSVIITEAEPFDEPGPRITFVNEAFTRLTGYKSDEVIGKSPRFLQGPNSDYLALHELGKKIRKWESCQITTLNYKKNGEPFWNQFSLSPVCNEKGWYTHWIAILRDVTEQKNRETEIELINLVHQSFSNHNTIKTCLHEILVSISAFRHFDLAEFWLPNSHKTELFQIVKYASTKSGECFYENSEKIVRFKFGEGLPGTAWKNNSIVKWQNVDENPAFLRQKAAIASGLHSFMAVPLANDDNVLGILVLAKKDDNSVINEFEGVFNTLPSIIAAELQKKYLEKEIFDIFNSVPDILFVGGLKNGIIKKINPSGEKILGHTLKRLTETPFIEFIHPDDRERTLKSFQESLSGKEISSFEVRWIKSNGEIRWISWTVKPDLDADLVFGSAKDVTERKQLERLHQKASKLAKIGSWEIDLKNDAILLSSICSEILGLTSTNVLTLNQLFELFAEGENRIRFKESVENCILLGQEFDIEVLLRLDGQNGIWVRVLGQAEYDIHLTVDKVYGSIQDVNEIKISQLELAKRSAFLQIISDLSSDFLQNNVWEAPLNSGLQKIGEILHVDRAYFFEHHTLENSLQRVYSLKFEWTRQNISQQLNNPSLTNIALEDLHYISENLFGGKCFKSLVSDITDSVFRKSLEKQGILSLLLQPVIIGHELYGFIGVDDCTKARNWSQEEIDFLNSLALNLAAAIKRIHYQNELNQQLKTVENYKRALDNSANTIITDLNGIILDVNDKTCELSGYSREELIGKHSKINKSGYHSTEFYKNLWNTINDGKVWRGELRNKHKNGSYYWIDTFIVPLKNSSNEIYSFLAIRIDITEKKNAEEKLQQALKEKTEILESIGDGFIGLDNDWRVIYWNSSAEHALNIKREEVIGVNVWQIFPEEFNQSFHKEYQLVKDNKEPRHFVEYFKTLNIWVEVSAYPGPNGISLFFRDITEKRLNEAALLLSNERFEKATLATQDAIWDWNLETMSFFRGDGYKTLFGYNESKNIKPRTNWEELIHPDDVQEVLFSLKNFLSSPKSSHWHSEYRFKKANGDYTYVADRGVLIRDKSGKAIRMVGAMSDISAQKHYEDSLLALNQHLQKRTHDLELSNAELEQFAFVASHDLQEPLRMVTSFLTQLQKKYEGVLDEKANQYIHFAVDGSKRMRQIILDLLEYSRVGKNTESESEVSVEETLDEIQLFYKKAISEKNIKIIHSDLPSIYTYKTPFKQILQNLIENAIKYSSVDRSPIIEITYKYKGDAHEFCISDNGIGIEEEYFEKIFVIFQRLHSKHEYEGNGMGLAIVKKIVENLGGRIWLESELNKGSRFFFSLPIKQNQ